MDITTYEILVVSDGVYAIELCKDCLGEGEEYSQHSTIPIWASTEMDRNPNCDKCGYSSFVFSPTSVCIDNWIDELREFVTGNDQRRNQYNRDFLDEVADRIPWVTDDKEEALIAELYEETRKNEKNLLHLL